MDDSSHSSRPKIALISLPWQDPFSPSIQLGSLKAWMTQERPDVEVDIHHLYLELASDIGLHLSKRISISWIGEALFAYLLFPERRPNIATFLEAARKDDAAFAEIDFRETIEALRVGLLRRLEAVDWSKYLMVGLSVVFAQTFSSLLTAREIKRRAPKTPIVFGGPGVTGKIGRSLLDNFDFIDYIINGEGERPLAGLVDLLVSQPSQPIVAVKGCFDRESPPEALMAVDQVGSLAVLPTPDYHSYFHVLDGLRGGSEARGRVRVPVETNRGCWWDRSLKDPMLSCSFCNLNLQWQGYRERPIDQSAQLFAELNRRHHAPDFTVVDNILRHRQVDEFIAALKQLDLSLDLWMEARVSVRPDQIRALREVGARVIQFGIESLSTSMLKKMVKGTTAMQNLQAMKLCEEYGIQNSANLIINYPGMSRDDILEQLRNIEFARSFYPLSTTEFSLVYQSPAYKAPERFGIAAIRNYEMYRVLLPPSLYQHLFLTEQSFDSEQLDGLMPLWRQTKAAADAWKQHYDRMHGKVEGRLLLSMQDGGTYLKVRDFRHPDAHFYWLEDAERDVYLECATSTSQRKLHDAFPAIPRETIDRWIGEWIAKRIAFVEGGKVLGLAIPWGPVAGRRTVYPRAAEENHESGRAGALEALHE